MQRRHGLVLQRVLGLSSSGRFLIPYRVRQPRYRVKTAPRSQPIHIKEWIVKQRGYKNIRLQSEQVAEFAYQPVPCHQSYRVVVLRKNWSIEKGEDLLFDDRRYFFYLTHDRKVSQFLYPVALPDYQNQPPTCLSPARLERIDGFILPGG